MLGAPDPTPAGRIKSWIKRELFIIFCPSFPLRTLSTSSYFRQPKLPVVMRTFATLGDHRGQVLPCRELAALAAMNGMLKWPSQSVSPPHPTTDANRKEISHEGGVQLIVKLAFEDIPECQLAAAAALQTLAVDGAIPSCFPLSPSLPLLYQSVFEYLPLTYVSIF